LPAAASAAAYPAHCDIPCPRPRRHRQGRPSSICRRHMTHPSTFNLQRLVPLFMLLADIDTYVFYILFFKYAPHGSGGFLSGLDLVVYFLVCWVLLIVFSKTGLVFLNKPNLANTYSDRQKHCMRYALLAMPIFPLLLLVTLMVLAHL
jgi:hypothetical protein